MENHVVKSYEWPGTIGRVGLRDIYPELEYTAFVVGCPYEHHSVPNPNGNSTRHHVNSLGAPFPKVLILHHYIVILQGLRPVHCIHSADRCKVVEYKFTLGSFYRGVS